MAEHSTEERNGHPRTTVRLQPGERVALCRCFGSKQFPFCDGTHREHPGRGPVIVEAPTAAGTTA
ncbi:MAG: CDGSH iron-sulfur domain-containing protein [Anaerolineae bacterium]|nr:CDGSH iron-sulfur domain-containing protein [Anaerolineae bacterium]MDW8098011.1 CDGSH iron-sulfur domain-containing protein [Anaerolineae bacterium]